MVRKVHAEGVRLRQEMRQHDTSGKWDVGYMKDGKWHHICRYSSEEEARNAAKRMENPSEDHRNLIGLTGNENLEVVEA